LNLYAYCANDPVNHVDPTGLGFFSALWHGIKKVLSNKWVMLAISIALTVIAVGAALHIINLTRALTATLGASGYFDAVTGASIPLTITIGHTLTAAGWLAAGLGVAAAVPTMSLSLKAIIRNAVNAGMGWANAQIPRANINGGTPPFAFQGGTVEQALSAAQADLVWNLMQAGIKALQSRPDCMSFIGPGADKALRELWDNRRITYFNGSQFSADTEPAIAATGYQHFYARHMRIVLGYHFFYGDQQQIKADQDGLSGVFDSQVQTLLHELKHYMMNNAPGHPGGGTLEWDKQIAKRCLK
jgi:hypothetical protein